MKPAFVQSPSSLATLHSSFRSLLNKCVAVYPEQNEGSHACTAYPCSSFYTRLIQSVAINAKNYCALLCCIIYSLIGFAQPDSLKSTAPQSSKPYYTLSAQQKKTKTAISYRYQCCQLWRFTLYFK